MIERYLRKIVLHVLLLGGAGKEYGEGSHILHLNQFRFVSCKFLHH